MEITHGNTIITILQNVGVLKYLSPILLSKKFHIVQSINLTQYSPQSFRRIRYTAISVLKDLGVIPKDTVVVNSLLSQLDITIPEDKVCKLRNDELTLSYVHRSVTHNYLSK